MPGLVVLPNKDISEFVKMPFKKGGAGVNYPRHFYEKDLSISKVFCCALLMTFLKILSGIIIVYRCEKKTFFKLTVCRKIMNKM